MDKRLQDSLRAIAYKIVEIDRQSNPQAAEPTLFGQSALLLLGNVILNFTIEFDQRTVRLRVNFQIKGGSLYKPAFDMICVPQDRDGKMVWSIPNISDRLLSEGEIAALIHDQMMKFGSD